MNRAPFRGAHLALSLNREKGAPPLMTTGASAGSPAVAVRGPRSR